MNTYEIRIHSLLDRTWQETFDVETFEHDIERGETLLQGELDQARLGGILKRIHDLGLQLVAVKIVEEEENAR